MPVTVEVCALSEFPRGTARRVQHGSLDIAVFHTDDGFRAIDDTCLHAGGPLHEGSILDGNVVCPWHHWEFDLEDGSCALNPFHKLAVYEVVVEDGQVRLRLP